MRMKDEIAQIVGCFSDRTSEYKEKCHSLYCYRVYIEKKGHPSASFSLVDFAIVYRKGGSLHHVDRLGRGPVACYKDAANKDWLCVEQGGHDEIAQLMDASKNAGPD